MLPLTCADQPVIDGPAYDTLRPGNSSWWLDGDTLHLELEKALEGVEWPEVVVRPDVRTRVVEADAAARATRTDPSTAAPSQAQTRAGTFGPSGYPPIDRHRPFNGNTDDEFLFRVD